MVTVARCDEASVHEVELDKLSVGEIQIHSDQQSAAALRQRNRTGESSNQESWLQTADYSFSLALSLCVFLSRTPASSVDPSSCLLNFQISVVRLT